MHNGPGMPVNRRSVMAERIARFAGRSAGYTRSMLWTILIILAIIALVLFIFGRGRL